MSDPVIIAAAVGIFGITGTFVGGVFWQARKCTSRIENCDRIFARKEWVEVQFDSLAHAMDIHDKYQEALRDAIKNGAKKG